MIGLINFNEHVLAGVCVCDCADVLRSCGENGGYVNGNGNFGNSIAKCENIHYVCMWPQMCMSMPYVHHMCMVYVLCAFSTACINISYANACLELFGEGERPLCINRIRV